MQIRCNSDTFFKKVLLLKDHENKYVTKLLVFLKKKKEKENVPNMRTLLVYEAGGTGCISLQDVTSRCEDVCTLPHI